MRHYKIEERPAEGLLLISNFPYGRQMWVLTERKVMKDHKCCMCRGAIAGGVDRAYRPVTNQGNRMDRICRKCGEPKLPASKKK